MRLSQQTLDRLPGAVACPNYDRDQAIGIVHFGLGAFTRAHQAWYTDRCLDVGERGWMVSGVSLRSAGVAHQLNPQDGLYTLVERSAEGETRQVLGAVGEVLVAGTDDDAIIARIASPDCHIVSFTVTEKGYCRAPDGTLDRALAEQGFYPLLEKALAVRQTADLPGLTLLSCDNLSGNGKVLRALLTQWFAGRDSRAADYFTNRCTTPSSMVDRIVPATTDEDLAKLEQTMGLRDEGAVFTEAFSQWVIEDEFADARPQWDAQGATIVADVEPYETAKLRMLNGAHSLLAYAGLDRGHEFVHQAIADPVLLDLVSALMRDEAAPTIQAGAGQDLDAYADSLIARFANPTLRHRLDQIAMDGSQKVAQRWLDTLAIRQERGKDSPAILTGLSHWLLHVRGDRRRVDDPMAGALQARWQEAGARGVVQAMFGSDGLIASRWTPDAAERAFIEARLRADD